MLKRQNPISRDGAIKAQRPDTNEPNTLVWYGDDHSEPGNNRALVFAFVFVPLMALAVICVCVLAVIVHFVTPAQQQK